MNILSALLIFGVVGALGRLPDIDINRVKRISNKVLHPYNKQSQQNGRLTIRSNDYDDHSGWYQHPRAPLPALRSTETSNTVQIQSSPVQIHQPREDPRLYYQSDAYLKELGGKNVNEEVTFIYPGGDVVKAGVKRDKAYARIRSNEVPAPEDFKICVKCPHDRTLIAKASLGRVVLQTPVLRSCSGHKTPRNVRFVHMYGPKMGSLLEQGSHMIIGRIMYKNKSLQLCKMHVHVVTQGCATPEYLTSHCWDQNKQCNFTCADKNLELSGPTTQVCGDDMRWKGELPVCKVRTWCEYPLPPDHGRVSCQGATAGNGSGLASGSRCRVKCARGFRGQRATVCRRGAWTNRLVCKPVHRNTPTP